MVEAIQVLPTPLVEPEGLLIEIPMPMERLYADVRAFEGTFERGRRVLTCFGLGF